MTEPTMKNIFSTAVVAAALTLSGAALAQTTNDGARGGAAAGAATGAVGGALVGGPIGAVIGGIGGAVVGAGAGSMTSDDRVYVQKYVYANKGGYKSVRVQDPVTVGKPLPASVRMYDFDSAPEHVRGYRYTYINDQYLLVDRNGNVVGTVDN